MLPSRLLPLPLSGARPSPVAHSHTECSLSHWPGELGMSTTPPPRPVLPSRDLQDPEALAQWGFGGMSWSQEPHLGECPSNGILEPSRPWRWRREGPVSHRQDMGP